MAHLLRLARAAVLLLLAFAAAPSMALEVIVTTPPNNCNAANHPPSYTADPKVSATWFCGIGGNDLQCGWKYVAPAYGWDGTAQNGVIAGQCTLPAPAYSCVDGAILGTNAHGARTCTCAAGLREQNGQCTALPPNCEAGHEWSDDAQACILKPCKPDEIRVNGVCVPDPDMCPDGKKKVNGKCENACPKAGTFAGEFVVGSITPTSFCENKCTVVIQSFVQAIKDGKVAETIGMGHYTGGECNGPGYKPPSDKPNTPGDDDDDDDDNGPGDDDDGGDGDNDPPRPPRPCPPGGCTGTDGDTPPGTEPDGEGKCPPGYYKSGGKCYPSDPPDSDPDGDGKCPPGTKKVGGRCVPYQPPSDDDQDEANEFCKKYPDVPMCKKSTWQGQCTAGFRCDGDAIFCAIASEQHARSCQLFDTKSAESDLYNTEKGKQGAQTDDLPGTRSESLANRISTADAFGAGQCIQDLTIVVAGQSISLPMSVICPSLGIIGNILVAVTLLLAIRIVGRG